MDQDRIDHEVDAIFTEILGYVPNDEEDLTEAMTSVNRLEFLIIAEERLGLSLQENDLAPDTWWGTSSSIRRMVRVIIDRPAAKSTTARRHG